MPSWNRLPGAARMLSPSRPGWIGSYLLARILSLYLSASVTGSAPEGDCAAFSSQQPRSGWWELVRPSGTVVHDLSKYVPTEPSPGSPATQTIASHVLQPRHRRMYIVILFHDIPANAFVTSFYDAVKPTVNQKDNALPPCHRGLCQCKRLPTTTWKCVPRLCLLCPPPLVSIMYLLDVTLSPAVSYVHAIIHTQTWARAALSLPARFLNNVQAPSTNCESCRPRAPKLAISSLALSPHVHGSCAPTLYPTTCVLSQAGRIKERERK